MRASVCRAPTAGQPPDPPARVLRFTQPARLAAHWNARIRPQHVRVEPVSYVGQRSLLPLTVGAIGIVYGDIGTSPLYAMRECFFGSHSVPPTHENVLGVLSLIIWSLLLVVSLKYVAIVMRADNQGEGGILALTALLPRASRPTGGSRCWCCSASSAPPCSTATA